MNAVEVIKTRRSIRRFTEETISKELMTEIIDLAKMAPSWKNTQTARYVVVQDEKKIKEIAENCVCGFEGNIKTLMQTKTLVVLCQVNGRCGYERDGSFTTNKGASWEMFDAGIAAQTFCLSAWEKGVGSVILGIFDDAKVGEVIGLPEGQTVAALIPVGMPRFEVEATPRKNTDEILSFI